MKIPEGMTEEEVIQAIQTVCNALIKFKFGPYDDDDIRQQGAVFGIEVLNAGRYDPRPGPDGKPTRPLANFIFTHVRNRIINFKRDKYRRTDPPCKSCHEAIPGRTEHDDGQYCLKYEAWLKRNMAKANLLCPADLAELEPSHEATTVEDDVATKELLALIDAKLPLSMRADYLRLRDGETVPKARKFEIEQVVREILQESLDG